MVIAARAADQDRQKKTLTTVEDSGGSASAMDMVRERSRNLHNFTSLPCFNVKWGRQKQLRCVKDISSDQYYPTSSSSPPHHHRPPPEKLRSATAFDGDGGIEAMREKLMLDFRTEFHQMKDAILNGDKRNADVVETRPWNLRTRRAVCKDPNNGGNGGRKVKLFPVTNSEVKSPPRRGGDFGAGPRAKFSAYLSKQEIEADFVAIMGNRPARRPKKRPKCVQKQIDALFPGYWLSEITPDMYKVNENPEAGKARVADIG